MNIFIESQIGHTCLSSGKTINQRILNHTVSYLGYIYNDDLISMLLLFLVYHIWLNFLCGGHNVQAKPLWQAIQNQSNQCRICR